MLKNKNVPVMDVMPCNRTEPVRKGLFAICLLMSSAAHAVENEGFAGELICSTGEPIKDAGVPELALPSISMKQKCEFRNSVSGESATYTGEIKLAQVSSVPVPRTFIWQVKASVVSTTLTSLLAQKFEAQPRERNEPLIAMGQTDPKIRIQRLTDRTKDNQLIMIDMHLKLLSLLT